MSPAQWSDRQGGVPRALLTAAGPPAFEGAPTPATEFLAPAATRPEPELSDPLPTDRGMVGPLRSRAGEWLSPAPSPAAAFDPGRCAAPDPACGSFCRSSLAAPVIRLG